jgi:hypothetical protein
MPTQIFQYFVPVGSTSVSITAAFFGAGGVTLDIETTQQSVATGIWEPFDVARTEIAALDSGATIDFGTRKFAATYSDQDFNNIGGYGIPLNKNITIKNGRFSLGRTADWQSIGDGVYAAAHDFSDYRSPLLYLQDENAQAKPLMRIDPLPPSSSDFFRFVYSGNYLVIRNNTTENGIVHTTGADNQSGQPITGFTIQDSTLKSQVNALLSGVTASSVAGPWAMIHSANNIVGPARIVGWDNNTGGLSFEGFMGGNTITYSSYASFVLCGLPDVTLNNGEYVVDLTNGITAGRVLYKPTNGNASDGRIPCADWAFGPAGISNDIVLDGLILEGNSARSTTTAMIRDSSYTSSITMKNCIINDAAYGIRNGYTPMTLDNNVFKRFFSQAAACTAGVTMTNNIIENCESLSAFFIQCQDGVTAIPHTYIADNVLSLESSTHGQGISLYKDSWRNATIQHNIFYNCQRAHSLQPTTAAPRPASESYIYRFENNLCVVDSVADIQGFVGGQKNISFNGRIDDGVSGGNQKAFIRSNTQVITNSVPSTLSFGDKAQLTSLDLYNMQHTSVVVENNIFSNTNGSTAGDNNGGHTHANNIATARVNGMALSTTDKMIHTDRDDYLVPNTFQGKAVAGGASDGGEIGIRWNTVPTNTQIQEIISSGNTNWASTYSASSLPTEGLSASNAIYNVRAYGSTGGGTGDLGPWLAANSSWVNTNAIGKVYAKNAPYNGATGWNGSIGILCAPRYGTIQSGFALVYDNNTDRDSYYNGLSGSYMNLSVTVTKGGSGNGYFAGATGQVYNYYWNPGPKNLQSGVIRWSSTDNNSVSGITANGSGVPSDTWPTSGITGSLWGDNPLYTWEFKSTPFISTADIDVARFAIPSGMVTTASTYTIDYVGENVNPAEYLTTAPTIIHNGVTAHVGTKTFLTYPEKGTTSSFLYRKEIELVPDSMNTFTLRRNATDTQTIKILHRPSINSITVANDADFAVALDGGYTGSGLTLDEILVNYNCTLNNVWNLQELQRDTTRNTSRRSFITVAPTGGNSVHWSGMEGMTNDVRSRLTYIRYKNCLIGSSSDSYFGGNYYSEPYANFLFDGCTFEARYNNTDYTNIGRPPGIRVTILGSSADIASIVAGEYVYQGNGGPTGDSAPTTSTNFGYVGLQKGDAYATGNWINQWITGTSAGVSFGQFNIYGQKQGTGVSGTYVAGATLNIAYNSNQSLGVTTGNIRGFTLESYTTLVDGDALPLTAAGIGDSPRKRTRLDQNWNGVGEEDNQPWRGYVDCNFVNLFDPGHEWASLMRDCRFSGVRIDIATGHLCSLNNYATDPIPCRRGYDTYGGGYSHVDLHQWFGNTVSHDEFQHENFYYGGHLVENSGGGTGDTELQFALFDRSVDYAPDPLVDYSDNHHIFIRDSVTRQTRHTANNYLMIAGEFHHIGINNCSLGGIPNVTNAAVNLQYHRNDSMSYGASFDNFYINGLTADYVDISYMNELLDQRHSYVNVIDTNDISSYLNGVTTEGYGAGITWSNMHVYPAPEYGTFGISDVTGDTGHYITQGNGGSFVNTFAPRTSQIATGITGANMSKILMYPFTGDNKGILVEFGTTGDKDNFQAANPGVTLEIVSTAGVTYTYGWTGGWAQWNVDTAYVKGSNETTGTTWDDNWTDLYARFGDNPKYKIEEN